MGRVRFAYPHGDQVEYNIFVFKCSIVAGKLSPIDGESVELRFFKDGRKPKLALPYPEFIFKNQPSDSVYFQWDEDWLEK